MGKPHRVNLDDSLRNGEVEHTVGSETSQYHEEKRLISISLVAASENEKAQTREARFCTGQQCRV